MSGGQRRILPSPRQGDDHLVSEKQKGTLANGALVGKPAARVAPVSDLSGKWL